MTKPRITPESMEALLRHFSENGGLQLMAYYECVERCLMCTIGEKWCIHGVTINDAVIYFIASTEGQKPIKFAIHDQEGREALGGWLEVMDKIRVRGELLPLNSQIPSPAIFVAGTTEYISVATLQQALAA